jgi:hypothetical protein
MRPNDNSLYVTSTAIWEIRVIGEVEGAAIGEAENMSLVVDGGVSPIAGKPEGQQHGWEQEQGRETEASHGVGIVPPPRVSGSV